MKAYNHTLRLTSIEIKNYSRSNASVNVSFDNLKEAKAHVENEVKSHTRSKKVNLSIRDEKYKKHYVFNKYTEKWEKSNFVIHN